MKFSVLLPTRNRLELLRYAIESVRRQNSGDWEVIVSDNESSEDVCGFVHSLNDTRIRYFRTERFVPVTENWNNALSRAQGDYVVMLGDDDCLLPGYFSAMSALVERYADPDCIYCEAVQFAYPGVMPGHEKGIVQTSYSDLLRGRREPGLLRRDEAREAVRKSMALRFSFSFNMQHSLLRRRFIDSLASHGPFFQSPYPDYYASCVVLLAASSIVAVPTPMVAIGISPKSFGYYYFNQRPDDGSAFLNNIDLRSLPGEVVRELLPGDALITCWYIAMACLERNYGKEFGIKADEARYRFLQVLLSYRAEGLGALRRYWNYLRRGERLRFTANILRIHAMLHIPPRRFGHRALQKLHPYPLFDPQMRTVEYKTILDLFEASS